MDGSGQNERNEHIKNHALIIKKTLCHKENVRFPSIVDLAVIEDIAQAVVIYEDLSIIR